MAHRVVMGGRGGGGAGTLLKVSEKGLSGWVGGLLRGEEQPPNPTIKNAPWSIFGTVKISWSRDTKRKVFL